MNGSDGFELRRDSAWQRDQLTVFLQHSVIPLRLGVATDGAPRIVPLWYHFDGAAFWCVTHRDAWVVNAVQTRPACAIDVSTNDVPYRGVRGAATARVVAEQGPALIEPLLVRYLGGTDSTLARWLLGRRDQEVALCLEPQWLTAWDFSQRMADVARGPDNEDSERRA